MVLKFGAVLIMRCVPPLSQSYRCMGKSGSSSPREKSPERDGERIPRE